MNVSTEVNFARQYNSKLRYLSQHTKHKNAEVSWKLCKRITKSVSQRLAVTVQIEQVRSRAEQSGPADLDSHSSASGPGPSARDRQLGGHPSPITALVSSITGDCRSV